MRSPRCIKVVLAAAFSLLALAAHAGNAPLRMGVEGAYPPFNYVNAAGKVQGFDVDIGEALCVRLARRCEWVVVPWDGLIPALQAGKFDVLMSSMTITPERRQQVLFTKPYYFSYGMMIANKGSGLSFTAESLKGHTVGVQAATTHEAWLRDRFGDAIELHAYPSSDDMFLDFQNGRLDAVFAEAPAMLPWMEVNGGVNAYEQIGENVTDPALGTEIGVAVRKDDTRLVDELNAALDAIVTDKTFANIAKKYFSFPLRP
ncbi:MAG: transporter substrate-binding domain-containing protein [Mesorhizobium sp.]